MKKGWQTKTLQSLCEDVNVGHVGPSSMHRDPNGISFLMGKNVGTGVIFTHNIERVTEAFHRSQPKSRLRPGDIVVVRIGKSGQAAKIPADFGEANCSGLVVIKQPHGIHPDFLVYYLNSPIGRGYSLSQARGSTRLTLNTSSVAETLVPVPPLAEQQRIVGVLDEAFAGLATAKTNAEKNLQNARALFESHLQSVFTQRGPGWVDRQLASLCHEITVGHVGSMKTEYKDSGIPFLRSQNIRPFEVSMENSMFIDETFHRALKKSQLRPGDLAIVRTGYPGTAAVIPPELPDSNCSDLVIVRPSKEVNPHFLAAFFNSAFGKQLVLGKIVGAAQKHFNITAAKEVMLHVPPIPEQRIIVAMVDDLLEETQRLARLYERKHAALEALQKSLLHQAFTGEL